MNLEDENLASELETLHTSYHRAIKKYEARERPAAAEAHVKVGDLVFVNDEVTKHKARDLYIVRNVLANLFKHVQSISFVVILNMYLPAMR